jgi:carboxylate-amine ligase
VDALTLGVEEEFQVVDLESADLVSRADELVALAQVELGASVSPELNLSQIEIDSPVCTTLAEVDDSLRHLRTGLARAGEPAGLGILATGTHPFAAWQEQSVNRGVARYEEMERAYGTLAHQQVICGCHVHVGIDDPEVAIQVLDRSRPWLATLLALSANSPFWDGADTGYASYRTEIWQRWPTAGMPPWLASRADYDDLVAHLVAIGAIADATYLYWFVRPSARFPTVEFRVCDVLLDVADTVTVAGLVRALAWTAARDAVADRPVDAGGRDALEASMWRAARYGLDAELVDPVDRCLAPAAIVVDRLLAHVRDGLEVHGDTDVVRAGVDTILARGNGATSQRRARATGGGPTAAVHALMGRTVGL